MKISDSVINESALAGKPISEMADMESKKTPNPGVTEASINIKGKSEELWARLKQSNLFLMALKNCALFYIIISLTSFPKQATTRKVPNNINFRLFANVLYL